MAEQKHAREERDRCMNERDQSRLKDFGRRQARSERTRKQDPQISAYADAWTREFLWRRSEIKKRDRGLKEQEDLREEVKPLQDVIKGTTQKG